MTSAIYKICDKDAWAAAEADGRFAGSDDDLRDGFIHFSTRAQLGETVAKHFSRQNNLVLVTVDPDRFGDRLRWEPSRGGDLFPHLYGALDLADVRSVQDLPLGPNGTHIFPAGITP